jgi:hypothetical protein
MIVPSTRIFTAGEIETGAYLNNAVTNMANFMLGKPVTSLYTTNAQSFTSGSSAAVTWATGSGGVIAVNRDNSWSSTNPTRFSCNTAGWYWVSGGANWASTAATYKGTYLLFNNSTAIQGSSSINNVASTTFQSASNALVYLNNSDYVELYGRCQGTNTSLAAPTIGSTATAFLNVVWVSL